MRCAAAPRCNAMRCASPMRMTKTTLPIAPPTCLDVRPVVVMVFTERKQKLKREKRKKKKKNLGLSTRRCFCPHACIKAGCVSVRVYAGCPLSACARCDWVGAQSISRRWSCLDGLRGGRLAGWVGRETDRQTDRDGQLRWVDDERRTTNDERRRHCAGCFFWALLLLLLLLPNNPPAFAFWSCVLLPLAAVLGALCTALRADVTGYHPSADAARAVVHVLFRKSELVL
ncbi:hypothetical protein BKA81DRAFT_219578 [Phyllosticta paracitricarpa]